MNQAILEKQEPNIIEAFRLGYQIVSQRLYLILFPLVLDLFLLFGPKFSVKTIFEALINQIGTVKLADNLLDVWNSLVEMAKEPMSAYNLASTLRTYPLGVPSLISGKIVENAPFSFQKVIQMHSSWQIMLALMAFTLIGLLLCSVFYKVLAQSILTKEDNKKRSPFYKDVLSFISLPFIFYFFALIIFIPMTFIGTLVMVFIPAFGTFLALSFYFVLLLALLRMAFAPHAVIFNHLGPIQAIKHSLAIYKHSGATNAIFLVVSLGLSAGLNLLWSIPKTESWMILIGVFGHALVTTVILVASFYYFRDAEACMLKNSEINVKPEAIA